MLLNLSDVSTEPLHRQIFRQLRAQILAGHLEPNEALPSIRGLAREQQVSVITVQRAYEDLERELLIRARRGKGFFVNTLDPMRRNEMAEQKAHESLAVAINEALEEGLEPGQVRDLVDLILKRGETS
jgi:GntR family transcriptional regulator